MNINYALSLVPNLITLARLLAVPVTIYVILEGYLAAAFWIFVAAAASDALDGYLAKRWDAVSEIGAYVALAQADHIATWLVFLVVFRDLLIIGGALLFHTITHSLKMTPLFISKVNTVTQLALVGVVLAELGLGLGLAFLSGPLVYIVALTTFVSGAAYVYKWGAMAVLMERDQ